MSLSYPLDAYSNKKIVSTGNVLHWIASIKDFNKIEIYNIQNGKLVKTIDYSEIKKHIPAHFNLETDGIDFWINEHIDTIIITPRRTNYLFLLNDKGKIIHKYEVNIPLRFDEQVISDYSLYSPVFCCDSLFFVNVIPRVSVRNYLERNKYYSFFPLKKIVSDPSHFTIRLKNMNIQWPVEYKDTTCNYRDFHPMFTYISSLKKLILSFQTNEKIIIYNAYDSTYQVAFTHSSYHHKFMCFDDDSAGNINYTQNFFENRCVYGMLNYAPSLHVYYRTYKLMNSEKWSLLFFNEKMEKIYELLFDNTTDKYWPYVFIDNKKLYLIHKRYDTLTIDEHTIYL